MLGVVLALLLQVTDPVQPIEAVAQAQPEATQTEAQPEQIAASEETDESPERRCRGRNVTGTRLSSVVTCRPRNSQQNYDTRETLRSLQRVDPPQSN